MEAEDTGLRINTQYPAAEVESAIPFMYQQKVNRILVNQGIVGGIIGKEGAKIKEI